MNPAHNNPDRDLVLRPPLSLVLLTLGLGLFESVQFVIDLQEWPETHLRSVLASGLAALMFLGAAAVLLRRHRRARAAGGDRDRTSAS